MIFAMATAPLGWVQQTANNDYAFRIVGTGTPSGGGSNAFSTVYSSATASGSVPAPVSTNVMPVLGTVTVGGVALTAAQLPPHTHPYTGINGGTTSHAISPTTGVQMFSSGHGSGCTTGSYGQSCVATHTHATSGLSTATLGSFSGSTTSLAIQYIDNIIAQYQK
jgi:hypothetical protein